MSKSSKTSFTIRDGSLAINAKSQIVQLRKELRSLAELYAQARKSINEVCVAGLEGEDHYKMREALQGIKELTK